MDVARAASAGVRISKGIRPDRGLRAIMADTVGTTAPRALFDGVRDALDGAARLHVAGPGQRRVQQLAAATGQPVDVARASFTYAPQFGELGAEQVRRGRQLVERALAGLEPTLVTNRYPETAAFRPDGFLPTRPFAPTRDAEDELRRVARIGWERLLGKHGVDGLEGRTVYASVQFRPSEVATFGDWGAMRGVYGGRLFGTEVFELSPSALRRTTIAARDSGLLPNPPRIAPMSQLRDVVLERLARTHGLVDDHHIRDAPRVGVFGTGDDAELRRQLIDLLAAHDDPRSVEAVRRYLASPVLTDIDHLIEAQVRGVRAEDVAARWREVAGAGS